MLKSTFPNQLTCDNFYTIPPHIKNIDTYPIGYTIYLYIYCEHHDDVRYFSIFIPYFNDVIKNKLRNIPGLPEIIFRNNMGLCGDSSPHLIACHDDSYLSLLGFRVYYNLNTTGLNDIIVDQEINTKKLELAANAFTIDMLESVTKIEDVLNINEVNNYFLTHILQSSR